MSEAMYAPPQAAVDVAEQENEAYYVVKPLKFYLMAVLTMNLYLVYWFYRNWRAVKLRTGRDIWPAMRALFSLFFAHSLFSQIDDDARQKSLDVAWRPMLMATIFVLLMIAGGIAGQLSIRGIGSPVSDFLNLLVAPVVPLLFLGAQRVSNAVSGDPAGTGNSKLTLANWAWVLFGGLIWLINLWGLYLMATQPGLFAQ